MRCLRWMVSVIGSLVLSLCLGVILCPSYGQAPPDPGLPGPYAVASMTVTVANPETGSDLETDIYYPSGDGNGLDPGGAPYPTLVFARGFMAFPTSYSGWGEHLASWGTIVAIPNFPSEDREVRVSDVRYLFSYLEAENGDEGSMFFQQVDVDRFGLIGHSAGGLSTLIVAARDERIRAAVALDPAGSPFDGWDYEADAPQISAPMAVIGAPSQLCNNSAAYNDWYPRIGAVHKAKFVIANGSHCDFMDTDEDLQVQLCSLFCGPFSEDRLVLAKRYATAWFNYYLRYDTGYHTYLYGDEADADIQADRITRDVHTAPRDVMATGRPGAVDLAWTLYDHPMVAGYNIYRSQLSGDYPSAPAAQVGRDSAYTDTEVVSGERYFYVLRSRDAAGNGHQASDEVSAVPGRPSSTASFDATPTDCCAPLTVAFTDTSIADTSLVPTNTIAGWHWRFGDGTAGSAVQNPVHTYERSGIYTVTLTVTDTEGISDTVMRPDSIRVNPPPAASVEASPDDCCTPLEVAFADASVADTSVVPTNTVEHWQWAFGDGTAGSTARNPVHTYEQPGIYTVTLTITDSHGCLDTVTQASAVVVNPLPTASFESSRDFCCAPLTVVFTDTSVADASIVPTNIIEGWEWAFGDGMASSSEQHPAYTYEQPGVYTVTLTVTDSHGCVDHAIDTLTVVREFESFTYLPLIRKGEGIEDRGVASRVQTERNAPMGTRLNRVLYVLWRLLMRPFDPRG